MTTASGCSASDSRLFFTAPAKGRYLIRVSDTRGWSGERFAYRLIVREPRTGLHREPGHEAPVPIPAGSGVQFIVKADRKDGWEGDVRVDISGVPAGFFVSSPVVVQAGHLTATGLPLRAARRQSGRHRFQQQ